MYRVPAESVHRDGERERRVDAAGEPHDDAGKAMFTHVVAHAERERAIDARFVRQLGCDGAGAR